MPSALKYLVAIGNTRESYACRADQTLLGGMEQLGRRGIPVGCRGGGCGICKVRIEAGTVRSDKMSRSHVSLAEEAQGFVLACRSYPQSDLRVQAVAGMARCLERRTGPRAPLST